MKPIYIVGLLTLAAIPAAAFAAGAQAPADAPQASADSPQSAPQPTIAELQHAIDVLGQEVQKLKVGPAAEPMADTMEHGFGPAASKVYRVQQGFSLGGYGEILLESFRDGFDAPNARVAPGEDFGPLKDQSESQTRLDIARAVLYAGYKFNDHWVLNSEFEWEHGGDEIEVEFLYLDYFWKPWLNLRVGNLLMPMGLTNETHEPTTYLGAHRPTLETLIIPTTWSEYGIGAFGDIGPVTYRTYFVTGLNASGFQADNGIEEGRHERGFANATRWAWVGRADYTAAPGLLPGASIYLGDASTTAVAGQDLLTVPAEIFEAHVQYNWNALDLRAMGAYSIFSNIDALDARLSGIAGPGVDATHSIGSRQGGFYLQAGYDLLGGAGGQSLVPFARWEILDTQLEVPSGFTPNGTDLIREVVAGVNYKPIPQLVFKADYEWFFMGDNSGVDQWDLAMGYVF